MIEWLRPYEQFIDGYLVGCFVTLALWWLVAHSKRG